jgi:hypothetical protein
MSLYINRLNTLADRRREEYEGLLHIFRMGAAFYANAWKKKGATSIKPEDIMRLSWDKGIVEERKMTIKEAKQLLGSKWKFNGKQ